MNTDIQNREDIDSLMKTFYSRAIADELIGHIFTDVAKLNLERHLPIIGDFWETILFQNGKYQSHGRSPLMVHGELNEKTPLLPEHFVRWFGIFTETVDNAFSGERADFIKVRARAIAARMLSYVGELNEHSATLPETPVEVEAIRQQPCHARS
ncbi:MAG: group III truncated hemoglobin [Pyrinomonadaceae bacterium]